MILLGAGCRDDNPLFLYVCAQNGEKGPSLPACGPSATAWAVFSHFSGRILISFGPYLRIFRAAFTMLLGGLAGNGLEQGKIQREPFCFPCTLCNFFAFAKKITMPRHKNG